MCLVSRKFEILRIFNENLEGTTPQLIASVKIAERLKIQKSTAQNFLRELHNHGDIITNLEGEFSLITLQGHSWYKQNSSFVSPTTVQ